MPPTTLESKRSLVSSVIRSYDARVDDVDDETRSLVVKINTASIDRYRTVIDPKGGRLANYNKLGRPVLWEHGKDPRRHTDPIATSRWIRTNGGEKPKEILAKPVFLNDEFSEQRYQWYRDGVLRGWSVNILPDVDSATPPTTSELRSRPEWEGADLIYRSWDLAEFSGTVIPGNAEALTGDRAFAILQAVERGLWIPDDLKPIIEEKAKDRTMTSATEGLTMQERYIRKKGEKWVVYSESGKELGSHDSEDDAKKQLAAIEANKHKDDSRSAPWIEDGNGVWIVRAADGSVVLSTADDAVAAQCLGLITSTTTSFESAYHKVIQENRAMFTEFRSDIKAVIDLMLHGRV